ncbi:flagellar hook-associated protein FlgK [Catenovulum sediminis]|uniref:Flagellar hook-associated protein 1 n=1 Tax=Catenovulum sediminis TaxID=1740262 RepID=A0ABV1RI40_9ALTE|nr:flagellar hook-associated protein FlgK [Catenovulum sediminis]
MTDLLKIGSSALLGNQNQLATTSNNIANINTPGYTRQRTEYTSYVEWGVGRPQVTRLFDRFALDQFRRDTSEKAKQESYSDNTSILDTLFSDDSVSISKGLDGVFQRLNEANDEPTALTPRQLVISDSQALVSRMQSLSDRVLEQEEIVNDEIKLQLSETNSLIQGVYQLNQQVITSKKAEISGQAAPELLDERNELIRQLAEKVNIKTMEDDAGGIHINTQGGQTLVTNGNYYQFKSVTGDPDPRRTDIQLVINNNSLAAKDFNTNGLGGQLGGLIKYREEVLDQSINSLGQLAIAFADAMNEQNKKGVTLDGQLGGDVFNIPSIQALGFQDNSSANHLIEVRVEEGLGDQVTNFDYQVSFTSATEYTVQAYQGGDTVGSASGPFTIPGNTTDFQGSTDGLPDGIEMRFEPDSAFVAGDTFLVRPTRLAGVQIETNLNRPEQLALAAPIKVANPIENIGDGEIKLVDISSTDSDNSTLNNSAFDASGALDADAPTKVVYTLAGEYEVQDAAGNVLGTATSGREIMAQLQAGGAWPSTTHGSDYPGYEVTISGNPEPGDEFDISFNSDALDDNFNGLKMTDLQSADTMRRNVSGVGNNTLTFTEAYSNLVGYIGDTANRAQIDLAANTTMLEQSETRVADMSGVNLDEEAADLVRYEQAYNASARIISVSQTLFDSLLQAVR